MSSKPVKKKTLLPIPKKNIDVEQPVNFRNFVINFSDFSPSEKLGYIYFGDEKISFRERDLLYQSIIRNEFADMIQDFIKVKSL